MKIAIVGSRDFDRLNLVVDYVKSLPKDTVIVSGGARGVDRIAAVAGLNAGLVVIEYRPDWEHGGMGAGFARNTLIVEQCDRVVAFWDGKSTGTLDTINKARKAGKPVQVATTVEGSHPGALAWGTDGEKPWHLDGWRCPRCKGALLDLRGQGFNAKKVEREGTCFWWADDAYTCVARLDPGGAK